MAALPPLSVTLAGLHRWLGPSPSAYVHAAQAMEDAGAHQVVLPEHVVMGPNTQHYPYGDFPYPPEDPWADPLTLLAAIAAVTSTVRLGTGVLIAPLRPAVVLAKQVATLDAISGGRLDLGVGVGWQREEFDAAGVPFERRWSRMDDQMRACRALWSSSPASFASDTVTFDGIWCQPQPVQSRLPLWVGAKATPAAGRRIAEWGDGWLPIGDPDPFALLASGGPITEAWEAAGRAPDELGIRVPLPLLRHDDGRIDRAAAHDTASRLAEAGATCLSVTLRPHDLGLDGAAAEIQLLARVLSSS